jgi:hypothetical protein
MTRLSRRKILQITAAAPAVWVANALLNSGGINALGRARSKLDYMKTTQTKPEGFYRLAVVDGRTWLVTPEGELFFSVGFNHIDPAALRYPENIHLWKEKYGNSIDEWLRESVRPNLLKWGFNSVGNTVEMASNGPTNHRQSRRFTYDEYQSLGMPYFHQLDFADFHHWDAQHRLPDFFTPEFEDWCDHVAREYCANMADDPKLIGYFYMDCPGWVHTHPHSRWRGPMYDFRKLETERGRKELFDLATQYYKVTHDAIRRYDKHHLIFGDRYEGRGRMAKEVLMAAKPYVDVLSFQYFGTPENIRKDLTYWSEEIGMPTLLADSAKHIGVSDDSPVRTHDTEVYAEIMDVTMDMSHCVGFHLCGAYSRNRIRYTALLDEDETPDKEVVDAITAKNLQVLGWIDRHNR